jgi:hypothetical protein
VASDKKAAVVSYDALRSGEALDEIPLRLKGLYPPSKVYSRKVNLGIKKKTGMTNHIISNQFQVASIDLNVVRPKNTTHLVQDGSASHFHSVSLQNRVDVVGVDVIVLKNALIRAGSELPQSVEIGPVCGKLRQM